MSMAAVSPKAATAPSMSFTIEGRQIDVRLPPPGPSSSVVVLGLPKAGSTLLHGMMENMARDLGLTYFALAQQMYTSGVLPPQVPPEVSQVFVPEGYLFGGFRGVPPKVELPTWASGRTILLVRDPRDMLTSLYFSHAMSHGAPGGDGAAKARFEQQRAEAQAQSIDDFALERSKLVAHIYRLIDKKLKNIDHKVYRYEDVIFEKVDWLRDIATYLKLPISDGMITDTIAKYDIVPSKESPDKHIRRVTPGDFESKLQPETIRQLDEAFADIYQRYGYKPAGAAATAASVEAPAVAKAPERKKIVFHIGMPKTGTTSIQGLLRKNDAKLRSVGVMYPGADIDPRLAEGANHRAFFSALTATYMPKSGMNSLDECRAALFKAVDQFRADPALKTLVISHESLAQRMGALDRSIIDPWSEEFDLSVVLYVRPMREWVESRYVQSIWGRVSTPQRAGRDAPLRPMAKTLMRRIDESLPSSVVDGAKAALPNAAIEVRSFVARRQNDDLIKNFIETTIPEAAPLMDTLEGEEQRRNPSRLSCNTMFMFQLQKGGASAETGHAVARALAKLTKSGKGTPPLADKAYQFVSAEDFAKLEKLDAEQARIFPGLGLDVPVKRKSDAASTMTEAEYRSMLEWLKPHITAADYDVAAASYKG